MTTDERIAELEKKQKATEERLQFCIEVNNRLLNIVERLTERVTAKADVQKLRENNREIPSAISQLLPTQ